MTASGGLDAPGAPHVRLPEVNEAAQGYLSLFNTLLINT